MKNIHFSCLLIVSLILTAKSFSQLQVTFSGDTTKIWDKNTYWYCGARFTMEVHRSNDSIRVTELDTMKLTTCMCYFTLRASVVGLPAGTYTAYVKRRLKVSIPGHDIDTTMDIGTISFTVNTSSTGNLVVQSYQSGCIQNPDYVDQKDEIPNSFYLLTNYPNPFNPRTLIHYAIPQAGHVTMGVYDIHGSLVELLLDTYSAAGEYNISFNGSGLSSGIYFVRLTSEQTSLVNKIVLLK
jgi:hypothetical protein